VPNNRNTKEKQHILKEKVLILSLNKFFLSKNIIKKRGNTDKKFKGLAPEPT
jgi:hypothetical protein